MKNEKCTFDQSALPMNLFHEVVVYIIDYELLILYIFLSTSTPKAPVSRGWSVYNWPYIINLKHFEQAALPKHSFQGVEVYIPVFFSFRCTLMVLSTFSLFNYYCNHENIFQLFLKVNINESGYDTRIIFICIIKFSFIFIKCIFIFS